MNLALKQFHSRARSSQGQIAPMKWQCLMKKPEYFDPKKLLINFTGVEGLATEAVLIFLNTLPEQIADVSKALNVKDHSELEIAIHRLRGSLSNFCTENLERRAAVLEKMAKSQQVELVKVGFQDLKVQIAVLKDELICFTQERSAA
jgi:HPt (histidine-containing phosphotransfer) domain-containing protein